MYKRQVEDGLTKKAVINSSRHKYVVMEKEKFYFNDSYKFAHFDDINGIVTDEYPDSTIAVSYTHLLRNDDMVTGRNRQLSCLSFFLLRRENHSI